MITVQGVQVAFEMWGSFFCLIALVCIFFARNIEKRKWKLLLAMQISGTILLSMDAFALAFRGYAGDIGFYIVRISNFFVFVMSDVIVLLFHGFVCVHIFEKRAKLPWYAKLVYWVGK